MKFTLTKDGKINRLVERFVLLEAVNYDTLVAYCEKILEFIKDQVVKAENDKGANKENNNKVEQIKEKVNNLILEIGGDAKKISRAKDPAVVKSLAEDCVTEIDTLLSTISDGDLPTEWSKAKKIFQDVKTLATGSDFTEETVAKLKEQLALLVAATENVINKTSGVSSGEDDKGTSKTASRGDFTEALQYTNEDIAKIKKLAEKGNPVLDSPAVVDTLRSLANTAREEVLVDFIEQCKNEHNGIVGSIAAKADVTPDEDDDLTKNRAKNIDWGKKYAAAENKKAFWENYFVTVWGDKAKKVAVFGAAYAQECEVYGFEATKNPFIDFLKAHFAANMPDISKDTYFAIHNAVARDTVEINKKNIKSRGTDDAALLRHKDFFMKPGNAADAYIEYADKARTLNLIQLQNDYNRLKAIDPADRKPEEELLYNVLTYFASSGKIDNIALVTWTILYDSVNLGTMEGTAGSPGTISADSKLRSLEDIKDLFNDLGIEVTVSTALTGATKNKLVNDVDMLGTAAEKSFAAKAIIYTAATTWLSGMSNINSALQYPKSLDAANVDLSDPSKYTLPNIGGTSGPADFVDLVTTRATLTKYATKYSKSNIEDLAKEFNAKGWLK